MLGSIAPVVKFLDYFGRAAAIIVVLTMGYYWGHYLVQVLFSARLIHEMMGCTWRMILAICPAQAAMETQVDHAVENNLAKHPTKKRVKRVVARRAKRDRFPRSNPMNDFFVEMTPRRRRKPVFKVKQKADDETIVIANPKPQNYDLASAPRTAPPPRPPPPRTGTKLQRPQSMLVTHNDYSQIPPPPNFAPRDTQVKAVSFQTEQNTDRDRESYGTTPYPTRRVRQREDHSMTPASTRRNPQQVPREERRARSSSPRIKGVYPTLQSWEIPPFRRGQSEV